MSDYPFHSAHLWINFKRKDFPRSQTILNAASIKPVVLPRNGKMENILDWKSQIKTARHDNHPTFMKFEEYFCSKYNSCLTWAENIACPTDFGLRKKRRRKERLDKRTVLSILKCFFQHRQSRARISENLKLPYTTVWSTVSRFNRDSTFLRRLWSTREVDVRESRKAFMEASTFSQTWASPFNSQDVIDYVKSRTDISITKSSVIKFLKSDLTSHTKRLTRRLYNLTTKSWN